MKLVVRENRIKTPAICTLICCRSRRLLLILTLASPMNISHVMLRISLLLKAK